MVAMNKTEMEMVVFALLVFVQMATSTSLERMESLNQETTTQGSNWTSVYLGKTGTTTSETLDHVNMSVFHGNEQSSTGIPMEACLEVSNLTIQETETDDGQAQLNISWTIRDSEKFGTFSCVTVDTLNGNCHGLSHQIVCDVLEEAGESTISSLCFGELYTIKVDYLCNGKNESLTVEYRTQTKEPSEPRMLAVTSSNSTSLTISWQKPEQSNGRLDGYIIQWSSSDKGDASANETSLILPPLSSSFTIDELQPLTMYDVKLMAFNYVNESVKFMSAAAEVNVSTYWAIPDPPIDLAIVNVTNSSLFITWNAPPRNDEDWSLNYTIRVQSMNLERSYNTSDTIYHVKDLLPMTTYNISVNSWNSAGHSRWTTHRAETNANVPATPRDLMVTEVDWHSINLTWKSPKAKPRTRLDGYRLEYVQNNSSIDPMFDILPANQTQYKIRELTAWTDYDLKLSSFCYSNNGYRLYSKQSVLTQRTGEYYPDAVENITILSVTNVSFTVKWDPPERPNGIIIMYTILLFNSSSQASVWASNFTKIIIRNLMPYTKYSFLVYAKNSYGIGNFSNPVLVMTDVGEPGLPEDLEFHSGARNISLSWKLPSYTAGLIDGYLVTWANAYGPKQIYNSVDIRTTNFNITDLSPWTEYITRVQAYNINLENMMLRGQTAVQRVRTLADIPSPSVITLVEVQSSTSVWLEWENIGEFPGPTTYVVQVFQNPDACSGKTKGDILVKNHTNDAISWKVSTTVVRDLQPYTVYFFVIAVTTDAGTSRSNKSHTVITHPSAPSEPRNFQANCNFSSTAIMVSWDSPEQKNGIIEKYQITYLSSATLESKTKIVVVKPTLACESSSHMTELKGLQPEAAYTITIEGKTKSVEQYGPLARFHKPCVLPAGVPPIPDNSSTPKIEETTIHEVTLKWSKTMFSSEMGQIMYYAVIVGTPNIIGVARNGSVKDIEPLPVWSEFFNQGSNIYQATPLDWNPFHTSVYDPLNCRLSQDKTLQCVIGWEKNCTEHTKSYCNGPLRPGKLYGMKLRGFTEAGFAETYPFFVKTESQSNGVVLGLSVGLVLTCLILVVISGIYLTLKRRRKLQTSNTEIIISHKIQAQGPGMSLVNISSSEISTSEPKEPLEFADFLKHIKVMMSDSALQFSLEYEILKKSSPRHSCTAAEMEENRSKNRWTNILPFDHSRVKLLPIDDELGSDYINASYIPGYCSHREYIASQGPLPATIDDFWRMIWEQKVSMIVMLTQCVERGKVKCERYWPKVENDSMSYGDLQVIFLEERVFAEYSIRILSIALGARMSVVKQMHYTKWPDFGCPETTDGLVNFVRTVKDQIPEDSTAPILVHCSAGVGRTGTFIAVDRLLQHVQCHKDIDIYNTVLHMREHRTNMVQTEDQYIYIHKCLRDIIEELIESDDENCNGVHVYNNAHME